MNQHITLKLVNREDFKLLVSLIERSGFRLLSIDSQDLEVECHLDNFVLSLAEKYLAAEVIYHNTDIIIVDNARRQANLEKVTR
jgi:hypothetical protein